MCIPPRIPLPVTILYVVTVTNLVILLNLTLVDANVRVLNRLNQTIVDSIMDLPAKFGKPVPDEGIWGHLIYAEPNNACSKIKPPPNTTSNESGIANKWIALVRRSECNFDTKVIEAQKQGYMAVIVHNIGSDKLVTMRGSGNQSKVVIPSIFIGYQDAEYLYEKCNGDIHYTIVIDTQSPIIDPNTARLIFSIFGIVIGSCFLTMIAFAVVKWIRDYRRRTRSRLSKANLKQLPVQKFKKGDVYDICAICLEEYEEGEKLRILPCNHAYHQKCIDPWLLKNKKTCPICKRKVMPSRNDSDSESDSDEQTDNEGTSESEPLLSASRLPGTRGNTFNNTGIPERLLHEYNFTSSDEEDDDSSLEDSLRPVTSHCQSSVEVHSEPDYRTAQAMRPPRRIGGLTARYAMFNESNNDDNPVNPRNQPDEAQATAAPSTKKPATKPKENRAWEYGLSPPKVNHFSIHDETQNIVEEEEPVAIEISPTGSQEEEVHTSSSGRRSRTEGLGAGGARKKKIKKSGPPNEKSSGGNPQDDGEETGRSVADDDVETGSTIPGTKKKSVKKHKSSAGVSREAGSSQKKPGKRVSPTGGVISPMDDGNNGTNSTETNENAFGGSDGPRLVDVGGMEKLSSGLNIQTDNELGVHGAVGGMDEDQLLEQPIVEVVGSGRHKSKKKKTTKKKQ